MRFAVNGKHQRRGLVPTHQRWGSQFAKPGWADRELRIRSDSESDMRKRNNSGGNQRVRLQEAGRVGETVHAHHCM